MKTREIQVVPYSHAKDRVVVRVVTEPGGFWKTREHRVIEAIGGRYVGRAKGYLLHPNKVERLRQLLADGWDATLGIVGKPTLIPPPEPSTPER